MPKMVRLSILSSSTSGLVKAATAASLRPTANAAAAATRSFSILPCLRPTVLLPQTSSSSSTIFRSPSSLSRAPQLVQAAATTTEGGAGAGAGGGVLDLVSREGLLGASPALAGQQIRFGPRPTMSGASRLIQKRRHGFLSRIRTKNGRKTLSRRTAKGRKRLSA